MKNKNPKYLIKYLCTKCNFTTYLDDLDVAECCNCENRENLLGISKEKIGIESLYKSIKELSQASIKAYENELESGTCSLEREFELRASLETFKKNIEMLDEKKTSKKEREEYFFNLLGENEIKSKTDKE
jgi:hypothetical protein